MKDDELTVIQSDAGLVADVRSMIEQTREGIARTVNAGMTLLYWRIGKRIQTEVLGNERAEYGEKIVQSLSAQLTEEFGRGFGRRSIFNMVKFAEVYPDPEIVQSLIAQLGWTHFQRLISLKDPLQRDFYAEMCRVERWSTRTLVKKIDSMLFERTAISKKPEEVARAELAALRSKDQLSPDLVFRDPYILDFLGLKDRYLEKDLEDAILRELETFLLELGNGFAFLGRQTRIQIDSDDFYLDLLFYCDDESKVIDFDLPLIIFGDHTRCFKYVDFPFVLGADGTKVLLPNKKLYDPRFYYFAMLALELPSRGYNRHFKTLKERIIQTTTELKKALIHKLFTEGLRNEPQKQTEIGPVPESWDVVPLSDCAIVQTGIAKGRKVDPEDAIELPYPRIANVQDSYLDLTEMKTITIRKKERERYGLQDGDVVLTEGGDFDKLGRGFIWRGQIEECVHQNHVFAVRPDTNRISSEFFAYQSQSPYGKAYFLSVAHKTTNLACINTTKLKAFPVLLPSQDEQLEIVGACQCIDGKIQGARTKRDQLQDIFRTLLHELMTAKTRVHKVHLSP